MDDKGRSMDKKKVKKIVGITAAAVGVTFIGLSAIAKKKKLDSVYESDFYQKNPLEGRKVTFVKDENDTENADKPVNLPVITSIRVETYGVDYGEPETIEPFNYYNWLMQQQYSAD